MGKCLAYFKDNLTQQTLGEVLDETVVRGDLQLTQVCLDFLRADEHLVSLYRHHVTMDTLHVILACDIAATNAIAVFRACHCWSKEECKRKKVHTSNKNKRKMLESILDKIPFSCLTREQVVAEVSPSGLLRDEQLVDLLKAMETQQRS